MKYVAFLDILGFKNRLKSIQQDQAKIFIGDFSRVVYRTFNVQNSETAKINGCIVSDSIVLNTEDDSTEALQNMVNMACAICREEFRENGILIRGAIAKGEFDNMPAAELANLQKQLMVGQAYVDAYLLEDKVKSIGICVTNEVYEDIQNEDIDLSRAGDEVLSEKVGEETFYVLRYLTMDFLSIGDNILKFIDMANSAKWLPHYYNTIHFAIKHKDSKYVDEFFDGLIKKVGGTNPKTNWPNIDRFIKNAYAENVVDAFKTRLAKYIRNRIFDKGTN